jgi:hypothetical protein
MLTREAKNWRLVLAAALALGAACPLRAAPAVPDARVSVQYGELVDRDIFLHSDDRLGALLERKVGVNALQPYLDPFSSLLQDSVEMLSGPDEFPHRPIVDYFPKDQPRPAWVAILAEGRISVTTDRRGHVRIFLRGRDPERAYQENYSVVRHCLASLAEEAKPLRVEVFAYENDYFATELLLNPVPYRFQASAFPPPAGKVPLDLGGITAFFQSGALLEGLQLDKDRGLVLFGPRPRVKPLIAGSPASISDFATAYRAAFHAGLDEAYVSLDLHEDSTRAKVNFGGLLENTRIGHAVLESDKRFKTISFGLDPDTYKDISRQTAAAVPSFYTARERHLVTPWKCPHSSGWCNTRFWFYPNSVKIETDPDRAFAYVTNDRFGADAERYASDYASSDSFEKRKKEEVSPSIREAIAHLNENYDRYAQAFGELRELQGVARMVGLAAWLLRTRPAWLDLDALLAVPVPVLPTPKMLPRIIAATVADAEFDGASLENARRHSRTANLSPGLDQSISSLFERGYRLASFLQCREMIGACTGPESGCSCDFEDRTKMPERFQEQAENILRSQGGEPVRVLVKSKYDLRAFAVFASYAALASAEKSEREESVVRKLESLLDEHRRLETRRDEVKRESELWRKKIKAFDAPREAGSRPESAGERDALVAGDRKLVAEHSRLVRLLDKTYSDWQKRDRELKSLRRWHEMSQGISGGIGMSPADFTIVETTASPRIERLRQAGSQRDGAAKSGLVVSRSDPHPEETAAKLPGAPAQARILKEGKGKWRDHVELAEGEARSRVFAGNTLVIETRASSGASAEPRTIVAEMASPQRIIFKKARLKN